MTLDSHTSVAIRSTETGNERPSFYFSVNTLCLDPHMQNLWGFSFCSAGGLICEIIDVARWTLLPWNPVFCFWQRCHEITCELTGLSSVPSIIPTGRCCPNGPGSLTDHCGNVNYWLITLLELICKTICDFFFVFSIGWQVPTFVCQVFMVTV